MSYSETMRKILAVIFGLAIAVGLVGCGQQTPTQAFVSSVRTNAGQDLSYYTDSSLVTIGKAICGVYRAGGSHVEVVGNIEADGYSAQFAQALDESATTHLCPEY